MKRFVLTRIACLGLSGLPLASDANAPVQNGWVQWQTATIEAAPQYCCLSWQAGDHDDPRQTACDLNQPANGINTLPGDHDPSMQIFAKFEAGKLVDIRSLSLDCEVRHADQAKPLGTLTASESLAVLTALPLGKSAGRHLQSMQLMSVALHPGTEAEHWLRGEFRSKAGEQRRDALFWMGQVRAEASKPILRHALLDHAEESIRRHACFVIAESKLPERFDWLLQAAKQDAERSVRHEAWFWYGHSQPADAERVIREQLANSDDAATRDHLVFVLSQLPAPRGTDALIQLLGDRQARAEVRKQALFWLGQSKDPRALAALDRYL